MKTQFSKAIMTAICYLMASMLYAQPFQQMGISLDWETQSNLDKVGIGNFSGASATPQSALHIDGNLVNTPTGEVFLTDAPSGGPTFWRMMLGGSEVGAIYNDDDEHFYIQASDGVGELIFNTGGANESMRIDASGNVGIGISDPAERLSVESGNIQVVTSTNS